ncbi:MAG: hypothetical protein KA974_07780 [Saprospiraceae bacterium]|nr:hypothetical protein [Saprospiraceae bacterium]
MKNIILIFLTTVALKSYCQDKKSYVNYNKLTVVEGTEFVIATVENYGKLGGTRSSYLLFADTKSGQTTQVDLSDGGYFDNIEQIKIDELGINKIIVSAHTVDLDDKKGINWNDPKQIIILSVDGKVRTQITENKFYVNTYIVNKLTGTIVIAGYYDINNNKKHDEEDKSEIMIYDLKTLKKINK